MNRFLPLILAAIPILAWSLDFETALQLGLLVTLAYWITAALFKSVQTLTRLQVREEILVAWTLCLTLAADFFYNLTPLWGVSLFLLIACDGKRAGRKRTLDLPTVRDAFKHGCGFLLLLLYLGAAHHVLHHQWDTVLAQHPAGTFLAIFLAAWMVKSLSRKKPGVSEG